MSDRIVNTYPMDGGQAFVVRHERAAVRPGDKGLPVYDDFDAVYFVPVSELIGRDDDEVLAIVSRLANPGYQALVGRTLDEVRGGPVEAALELEHHARRRERHAGIDAEAGRRGVSLPARGRP